MTDFLWSFVCFAFYEFWIEFWVLFDSWKLYSNHQIMDLSSSVEVATRDRLDTRLSWNPKLLLDNLHLLPCNWLLPGWRWLLSLYFPRRGLSLTSRWLPMLRDNGWARWRLLSLNMLWASLGSLIEEVRPTTLSVKEWFSWLLSSLRSLVFARYRSFWLTGYLRPSKRLLRSLLWVFLLLLVLRGLLVILLLRLLLLLWLIKEITSLIVGLWLTTRK